MSLNKENLNNFLPNGFETENKDGYKTNFSSDKIATGYEKDVADIVSGPNLNNFIDKTGKNFNTLNKYVGYLNDMPIGSSPVVDSNNKLNYEAKVSKSGDIMSGNLTIHNNQNRGMLFLQNKTLDYENYVRPSQTVQSGIVQFIDKNNQFYGFMQHQIFKEDGNYNLSLGQRRKINGQDVYCNFESYINENGDCFCMIPNTIKIDGQWVYKSTRLIENYTIPLNRDASFEIDLSAHLPNDNYNYEIILSADAYTGSANGASITMTAVGQVPARILGTQTRSQYAVGVNASCIVPLYKKAVTISTWSNVASGVVQDIFLEGYRRIGTNL